MYFLRVFGGLRLRGPSGPISGRVSQRRPLALLAALAVMGDDACTRDQLAGLLWGDADDQRALSELSNTLYVIHHALGTDAVVGDSTQLRLNSAVIDSDIGAFRAALEHRNRAAAAAAYAGPLLEGFHPRGAAAFEEWLSSQRHQLAARYADALEGLVKEADASADYAGAAAWWQKLAAHDPYNSRVAVGQAFALAAVHDRANGLQHLRAHIRLLREEMGLEPDVEVLAAERILLAPRETLDTGPRLQAMLAKKLGEPEFTVARAHAGTMVTPRPVPSGSTTSTEDRRTTADRRKTALRPTPRRVPWAAGVAALAVVALVVGQVVRPKPLNVTVSDLTPVTSGPTVEFEPAISPDGQDVAYAAGPIGFPHLFVRTTVHLAGAAQVSLADTTRGSQWLPAWTPDGQLVRFMECPRGPVRVGPVESLCRWREVGRLGGAARTVGLPEGAARPAWSEDGARVAFVRGDTIFTSSPTDTATHRVAIHGAERPDLHSLAWSPDGKRIAYVNGPGELRMGSNRLFGKNSSIWVVDASGGEPQRVTASDHLNVSPAWLDRDHLLYISDREGMRAVYVVAVGAHGARGEPIAVPGVSDAYSLSFSRSVRSLAFAKLTVRQNIRAYPLGRPVPISIRDGRSVTAGDHVIVDHDVSPDGQWIVFDGTYAGAPGLFRIRVEGGEAQPLSSLPAALSPRWSPDGREIAFPVLADSGHADLMLMPAEGGVARSLAREGVSAWPSWSPDGLRIVFWKSAPNGGVWLLSRDSLGGAWHQAVRFSDLCSMLDWAPDGSTLVARWCSAGGAEWPAFMSPQGRMLTRGDLALSTGGLTAIEDCIRYSPDSWTLYAVAANRDGRRGVWALPVGRAGEPRLVVAFDDPTLSVPSPEGNLSVGPGELYLTVAEHQSVIWVAKLRW